MPKYYCDYCDTYLTHDSPSVRKTHCQVEDALKIKDNILGRKHKDNVKFYYQKWMEEQAQHLIDATTAAFKAGKIATNPYAKGAAIPPPQSMQGGPRPGGPPGPMPPGMMGPGPMPPMMMNGPMRPMGGPMMNYGPMNPMMMMGPMGMRPMGPPMMGPMRPMMNIGPPAPGQEPPK